VEVNASVDFLTLWPWFFEVQKLSGIIALVDEAWYASQHV
jgi:hypothetical protein